MFFKTVFSFIFLLKIKNYYNSTNEIYFFNIHTLVRAICVKNIVLGATVASTKKTAKTTTATAKKYEKLFFVCLHFLKITRLFTLNECNFIFFNIIKIYSHNLRETCI